jgi:hypothetical protein
MKQVSIGSKGNALFVIESKSPLPSTPKVKDDVYFSITGDKISPWGDDNLYPQHVYELASKNSIVPAAIAKRAELLVSAGWELINKRTKEPIIDGKAAEIEDWLSDSNFNTYLLEAASDLYWFANFFPEIVRDPLSDKIVAISAQEAMFCRYSRQAPNGSIPFCYINANWGISDEQSFMLKRRVIDRYFRPDQALRQISGTHFIYPVSYPSPGKTFYQTATWHSVINSRWLELSNQIPAFKTALMKNQMTIKYIVEIAYEYWEFRYPDFNQVDEATAARYVEQTKEEIEEKLMGVEQAGKTLFIPTSINQLTNTAVRYINITPLEDKLKDGAYIEDSQEASSHLLYALGVPAALIGNTPGKGGMGAGSGSDVREHLNLYLFSISIHQDLILEPLNRLVFPYNGWNDVLIRFKKPFFTTQNQTPPANRVVGS